MKILFSDAQFQFRNLNRFQDDSTSACSLYRNQTFQRLHGIEIGIKHFCFIQIRYNSGVQIFVIRSLMADGNLIAGKVYIKIGHSSDYNKPLRPDELAGWYRGTQNQHRTKTQNHLLAVFKQTFPSECLKITILQPKICMSTKDILLSSLENRHPPDNQKLSGLYPIKKGVTNSYPTHLRLITKSYPNCIHICYQGGADSLMV